MQPGKVPMLSKQLSREDRLAQQPMDQPDPETPDDFEAVYNGGLAFQVCHVVLCQPAQVPTSTTGILAYVQSAQCTPLPAGDGG